MFAACRPPIDKSCLFEHPEIEAEYLARDLRWRDRGASWIQERLAAQMGSPPSDLFRSGEELVEDRYARRGREIEHVETNAVKELS